VHNLSNITYNNLWKLLIDRDMTKMQLKELAKVSSNVIAKMGKNEPISIDSLVKICLALGVDIGDVISIEKIVRDDV
jgi:DNA (cytosine-5)-methyltransferase 1